jgi:hypothetical protein
MTALRMFVLGLFLVNIVLLTVRALQPGAYCDEDGMAYNRERTPLPSIELVETLPPEHAVPEPAQVEESADKSGAIAVLEPPRCIRVGPFADENESAGLRSELQTQFERVQTRESTSVVDLGYWVNIPPLPTRAEAQALVEKLTAAEVKDFYVVPRGLSANAIALGVFQSPTRAENRRKKIRKLDLGVDVIVELQTQTELNYWLEAGPVDTANQSPNTLFSKYPDLQRLEINCPMEPAEPQQSVIVTEVLTETAQEDEIVAEN